MSRSSFPLYPHFSIGSCWSVVQRRADNLQFGMLKGWLSFAEQIRVPDLALMKERHERIVMFTAYDEHGTALRFGRRDILLVGDPLLNVILGLDTTVAISFDAVIHPTRAVARGRDSRLNRKRYAFSHLSGQCRGCALRNAGRLFQAGEAARFPSERRILDEGFRSLCSVPLVLAGSSITIFFLPATSSSSLGEPIESSSEASTNSCCDLPGL
jgi:Ketopantoate hydroxymethyltransferase